MSRQAPSRVTGLSGDDTGCHILHVDMDAFYASVEIRDRPELAHTPVIVGGLSGRSVVLSATYEARSFGVRSAMPMSRARRLCPHAVVIPPRHRLYGSVSKEVMAIFRAVTPLVQPLSLDEAFLDVSGAIRLFGTPASIGQRIRREVAQQQQITCSVGVATTKFLAKLASVHAKPDGLLVIPADSTLEFLHPLPISALWGVGDKTGETLARLGLRTVGDIAATPLATLERDVGKATAAHLHALASGRDDRAVEPAVREKSVGSEETFEVDVSDPAVIRRELLRLSRRTARSLRSSGYATRTVVIKLRKADFTTITRSKTLPEPTSQTQRIYATACALYASSGLSGQARLRLVGVRATGLVPDIAAATQLALGERGASWQDAESALDRISGRFGPDAVRPASLVDGRTGAQSRPHGPVPDRHNRGN
ncbi:MAG TPA: DNA polymerase IV [Streptosporangiaceae bacterium]|nr:DNA polymerase IV [Streptosporangiaceae bacterium]